MKLGIVLFVQAIVETIVEHRLYANQIYHMIIKGGNYMKYVKTPASKYVLGFCNVCSENCHNDCGQQKGCGYCASYTS